MYKRFVVLQWPLPRTRLRFSQSDQNLCSGGRAAAARGSPTLRSSAQDRPTRHAIGDAAYSLPDTYVGEEGTGWIDHWAISQGKIPQGAPKFPQWEMDRTKELHLSTGQVSAEPTY